MDSPRPVPAKRIRRGRRAAAVASTHPVGAVLPRWVKQDTMFFSADVRAGAALFALDQVMRSAPPWLGCLRNRLALRSAVACIRLLRLSGDEAALRDADHLTRPGDDPGPAGRVYRMWRRFGQLPTRRASETLDAYAAELTAGGEGAVEALALMRADAELANACGWDRPVPLAATAIADPLWRAGGEKRQFRVGGAAWEAHRLPVFGLAAMQAHALAIDLSRRAEALTVAADGLRTRDGGAGVSLILAADCVAPWRMVGKSNSGANPDQKGLGSDRAARRLCETLHALGVLRLLTDRPTFRLYGL